MRLALALASTLYGSAAAAPPCAVDPDQPLKGLLAPAGCLRPAEPGTAARPPAAVDGPAILTVALAPAAWGSLVDALAPALPAGARPWAPALRDPARAAAHLLTRGAMLQAPPRAEWPRLPADERARLTAEADRFEALRGVFSALDAHQVWTARLFALPAGIDTPEVAAVSQALGQPAQWVHHVHLPLVAPTAAAARARLAEARIPAELRGEGPGGLEIRVIRQAQAQAALKALSSLGGAWSSAAEGDGWVVRLLDPSPDLIRNLARALAPDLAEQATPEHWQIRSPARVLLDLWARPDGLHLRFETGQWPGRPAAWILPTPGPAPRPAGLEATLAEGAALALHLDPQRLRAGLAWVSHGRGSRGLVGAEVPVMILEGLAASGLGPAELQGHSLALRGTPKGVALRSLSALTPAGRARLTAAHRQAQVAFELAPDALAQLGLRLDLAGLLPGADPARSAAVRRALEAIEQALGPYSVLTPGGPLGAAMPLLAGLAGQPGLTLAALAEALELRPPGALALALRPPVPDARGPLGLAVGLDLPADAALPPKLPPALAAQIQRHPREARARLTWHLGAPPTAPAPSARQGLLSLQAGLSGLAAQLAPGLPWPTTLGTLQMGWAPEPAGVVGTGWLGQAATEGPAPLTFPAAAPAAPPAPCSPATTGALFEWLLDPKRPAPAISAEVCPDPQARAALGVARDLIAAHHAEGGVKGGALERAEPAPSACAADAEPSPAAALRPLWEQVARCETAARLRGEPALPADALLQAHVGPEGEVALQRLLGEAPPNLARCVLESAPALRLCPGPRQRALPLRSPPG